jgi:hypothetical protein
MRGVKVAGRMVPLPYGAVKHVKYYGTIRPASAPTSAWLCYVCVRAIHTHRMYGGEVPSGDSLCGAHADAARLSRASAMLAVRSAVRGHAAGSTHQLLII